MPAPPPSTEGHVGTEELPADHLARLRDSDALLHVVRAFEDPANPHPEGSVDPARDLERLDLEFMLADLSMAERRLERLKGSARHGTSAEREAAEREEVVVVRIHEGLKAGSPIRDLGLDADDEKPIRGFRFLTQKPVLVLLNVGEKDLADGANARRADRRGLSPQAGDGRGAVGQDRDGARRARARRGGRVHGGARDRRVRPGPGDRAVLPAARAHLVPDRRSRRGAGVADPGRIDRRRRGRQPSTPTSPRGSSGPRPSPTTTWSSSARWPRRGRPAGFARRARPTRSTTATSSRSSSADKRAARALGLPGLSSGGSFAGGSNSARTAR